MHPILFKIGPLTIYTYGFFVFLGVVCGYIAAQREAMRKGFSAAFFSNLAITVIICAFLGAKILYVFIEWDRFLESPLAMLRSGFVFYGGIIAGLICLWGLAKKYRIGFLRLTDTLSAGVPLGHAFGRIGCFFYGCCYGRPTHSWIGVRFPQDSPAGALEVAVIPTQLISAAALFVLFFVLWAVRKKLAIDGQVTFLYLFIYGIFRFSIEFFRADPRGFLLFFSIS
jgi:phosphatidylglycerol:prolipoprotein diacylglycerol transferase